MSILTTANNRGLLYLFLVHVKGRAKAGRWQRLWIILYDANPMSGVFRNIDPPPPHRPASVYVPPAFGAGGGHTRWMERGWGGQLFGRRQTLHFTLYM
jgi:hypothetical protein